ncbi:hypothetical protein T06_484 [Trichinella sp. T6]|nr:hypothetical protein T06_8335 [Trichinella sp. T6]KRX58586.1 hypothetical protein T06_484 [Trichinella sp. T6]
MTYRFTISDIEEVALSNFLTDDLHIDHYEDDILKSRSSSWKWNNMILPLVNCRLLLNCICSPEYLLQLNAEYAADHVALLEEHQRLDNVNKPDSFRNDFV